MSITDYNKIFKTSSGAWVGVGGLVATETRLINMGTYMTGSGEI